MCSRKIKLGNNSWHYLDQNLELEKIHRPVTVWVPSLSTKKNKKLNTFSLNQIKTLQKSDTIIFCDFQISHAIIVSSLVCTLCYLRLLIFFTCSLMFNHVIVYAIPYMKLFKQLKQLSPWPYMYVCTFRQSNLSTGCMYTLRFIMCPFKGKPWITVTTKLCNLILLTYVLLLMVKLVSLQWIT